MPGRDAGIPRHEIGSFKLLNLKKICVAAAFALTLTSSGIIHAAEHEHKVLGLIEFGKTTVPEVAEQLKGKCHPTTSDNSSFSSTDQNCIPALQNIKKIAGAMYNIHEKESPDTAVFIYAIDGTNMIGLVKVAFIFTDSSKQNTSFFNDLIVALLETTYGNRTIDKIWRTKDYTVSIEKNPSQNTDEPERLEICYMSRHAGRIEWYLNNPEFKLNNPEQRKPLEDAVLWTKELNKIL